MAEHNTVRSDAELNELKAALHELLTTGRMEIARKIRDARSNGRDLSDNDEYDAAKEEQVKVEARIDLLRKIIRGSEIKDKQ